MKVIRVFFYESLKTCLKLFDFALNIIFFAFKDFSKTSREYIRI